MAAILKKRVKWCVKSVKWAALNVTVASRYVQKMPCRCEITKLQSITISAIIVVFA